MRAIWLSRHLKSDFKTIADFRCDNRKASARCCGQFVLLCEQLNLFGRELLAVDGTRIKAVNNKDRNFKIDFSKRGTSSLCFVDGGGLGYIIARGAQPLAKRVARQDIILHHQGTCHYVVSL
jgi:hypothetical protein